MEDETPQAGRRVIAGRFALRATAPMLRPELTIPSFAIAPRPVDVLRADDLLLLRFSFVNLKWDTVREGAPPRLVRAATNRQAYLVATFPSQHVVEEAFFESGSVPAPEDPPAPLGLAAGTSPPQDPDAHGATQRPLDVPPVFASLSGPTRLVFKVGGEALTYTVEGLLDAMARLPLSVGPTALAPPPPRILKVGDLVLSPAIDLSKLFGPAGTPSRAGRRRRTDTAATARISPEFTALARLTATGAQLQHRFGPETALTALAASRIGAVLDVGPAIAARVVPTLKPPPPSAPKDEHTAIELPWRLLISPNAQAGWAHARVPVEHDGRVELWHSRMGVRTTTEAGEPGVDEEPHYLRAVRAVWARDFSELAGFPFTRNPASEHFPEADGSEDDPEVRMSLNSRDRMMLVHETSNFHLLREREPWPPRAVPTERLMLSSLGGWLRSRVTWDELPDGGLTIEEWKHRAGMGRDHEVKVVYAGFLLPFGHRASLVKVTERKITRSRPGTPAYLFQRMFIIVRQPDKTFRGSNLVVGGERLDNQMPLASVRIVTGVTPDIAEPVNIPGKPGSGRMFVPFVGGSPFPFKLVAVDVEGNLVEFQAPLVFMERDLNVQAHLPQAMTAHNALGSSSRLMPLRGQKVAFAPSEATDDTTLSTASLIFDVVVRPDLASLSQDEARFLPVLKTADAVVPAMSALAGAATPVTLEYPKAFKENGFSGNAGQVFLALKAASPLNFAGQGDRSGGLVTPSVKVSALSRLTGPIGGDIDDAVAGTFDPSKFFDGISAKLFGVVELKTLLAAVGFSPDTVPTFVAQTLNVATTLSSNVDRLRQVATDLAAQVGAPATALRTAAETLVTDLAALAADPGNPPDIKGDLESVQGALEGFRTVVESLTTLPRAQRDQVVTVVRRVQDQLDDVAAVDAAAKALIQLAKGATLPDVVTARLDWSTDIPRWPAGSAGNAILSPVDAAGQPVDKGRLTLAVEIQAPTKPGKEPSAVVSCSISPFDLRLIGPSTFIKLRFQTMEFSVAAGKKPDVNVAFRDDEGIVFDGPLSFVNTLKDIIPFDGFSDPPYLDVTAEGVKAGFDLAIPNLAVGVLSLENIALGAHLRVPFIDESLEVAFNFCTRENPFRLTVMLFGGGGFFGITLTPSGVRVLEASFEFGAAISVNFGVASGGVSVMAGIYFRLETKDGKTSAQLTGYFRLRGEVDVLGLISASIELYLEFTYETSTGKAVGRATLTIEVEVLFLSFSVQISCEKKLAGSNGDPSFEEEMGLPPGAPPGTVRPWDEYCEAFA